jgi:hypothetical protein
MMVAVKSEDLEFSPLYLGNFSKGDAEKQYLGFRVRPTAGTHCPYKNIEYFYVINRYSLFDLTWVLIDIGCKGRVLP